MTKKQKDNALTSIEKNIIILQEQSKNTTEAIAGLVKVMEEHDKVSQIFREKTITNCNDINWLRWGIRILYGSGVVGILVWLISVKLSQ